MSQHTHGHSDRHSHSSQTLTNTHSLSSSEHHFLTSQWGKQHTDRHSHTLTPTYRHSPSKHHFLTSQQGATTHRQTQLYFRNDYYYFRKDYVPLRTINPQRFLCTPYSEWSIPYFERLWGARWCQESQLLSLVLLGPIQSYNMPFISILTTAQLWL